MFWGFKSHIVWGLMTKKKKFFLVIFLHSCSGVVPV